MASTFKLTSPLLAPPVVTQDANAQGALAEKLAAQERSKAAALQSQIEAALVARQNADNEQSSPDEQYTSTLWFDPDKGKFVAQFDGKRYAFDGNNIDTLQALQSQMGKAQPLPQLAPDLLPVEPDFTGRIQYLNQHNYSRVASWYRKAAEQGEEEAPKNLGVAYGSGQGVQAATRYRKAAEQGFAAAQYNLGVAYGSGQGVPQDYSQAAYWYRKAAEQGFARAQNNLGALYHAGQGVPQDYSQAAYWYRKAAEQGFAAAQFNLGMLYENGQGVPQDYVTAAKWLSLAKAAGEPAVDYALGLAHKQMTRSQIAESQRLASQWWAAHHKS